MIKPAYVQAYKLGFAMGFLPREYGGAGISNVDLQIVAEEICAVDPGFGFDESGEGLTPSHAVKSDRRYRYYVSRSLMKGPAARVDGGWRLPAAEIERSIAAAAQSILDDQQTVISAVEEAGLDSSRIAPLLKSAAVWSERLQFEQDSALSSLIDRVDLGQDGMRLSRAAQKRALGFAPPV
jgi:hypothetical protein